MQIPRAKIKYLSAKRDGRRMETNSIIREATRMVVKTTTIATTVTTTIKTITIKSQCLISLLTFICRKYQTDRYQTDKNNITKVTEITKMTDFTVGVINRDYMILSNFVSLLLVSLVLSAYETYELLIVL